MSSCLAAARPGMISTPTSGLGLPGLSGGGRRRRDRRGVARRRRTQRGGRYSFDLSAPAAGGTPWGTGIPQVMRIPCEGSIINPLNPGPHTPNTQPPIRGGGGLGVDNVRYTAPTAGYTNAASSWVGSTGSPVMVQTPYDARALNPACLKTGGGRRRGRGRRNSRGRFTRRR